MKKLFFFVCTVVFLYPLYAQTFRNELIGRRDRLSQEIGNEAIFVLFNSPVCIKNNTMTYKYLPDMNLYYFTGIPQKETILVIFGGEKHTNKAFLFIKEPSLEDEIWNGKMFTIKEAQEISGITNVYYERDFGIFLENTFSSQGDSQHAYGIGTHPFWLALSEQNATVYLDLRKSRMEQQMLSLEQEFIQQIQSNFPGVSCKDGSEFLAKLRLRKSLYEIQSIQKAIDITEEAIRYSLSEAKPNNYEYEVEAAIQYIFKKNNMENAFSPIIASGSNSCFLHYVANQRQMQAKDLLLLDVGACYQYYNADITRTIPVSGRFTEEQKEIYKLVLEAQKNAIAAIKPGATLQEVHHQAVLTIKKGLFRLGLITEEDSNQYLLYFMHQTSHWLGLDVHDVGLEIRFEPRMVLTVEPGIYISPDILIRAQALFGEEVAKKIKPAVSRYQNIGIRIEDDVMVTENGSLLLSKIPKGIEELEEWIVTNQASKTK